MRTEVWTGKLETLRRGLRTKGRFALIIGALLMRCAGDGKCTSKASADPRRSDFSQELPEKDIGWPIRAGLGKFLGATNSVIHILASAPGRLGLRGSDGEIELLEAGSALPMPTRITSHPLVPIKPSKQKFKIDRVLSSSKFWERRKDRSNRARGSAGPVPDPDPFARLPLPHETILKTSIPGLGLWLAYFLFTLAGTPFDRWAKRLAPWMLALYFACTIPSLYLLAMTVLSLLRTWTDCCAWPCPKLLQRRVLLPGLLLYTVTISSACLCTMAFFTTMVVVTYLEFVLSFAFEGEHLEHPLGLCFCIHKQLERNDKWLSRAVLSLSATLSLVAYSTNCSLRLCHSVVICVAGHAWYAGRWVDLDKYAILYRLTKHFIWAEVDQLLPIRELAKWEQHIHVSSKWVAFGVVAGIASCCLEPLYVQTPAFVLAIVVGRPQAFLSGIWMVLSLEWAIKGSVCGWRVSGDLCVISFIPKLCNLLVSAAFIQPLLFLENLHAWPFAFRRFLLLLDFQARKASVLDFQQPSAAAAEDDHDRWNEILAHTFTCSGMRATEFCTEAAKELKEACAQERPWCFLKQWDKGATPKVYHLNYNFCSGKETYHKFRQAGRLVALIFINQVPLVQLSSALIKFLFLEPIERTYSPVENLTLRDLMELLPRLADELSQKWPFTPKEIVTYELDSGKQIFEIRTGVIGERPWHASAALCNDQNILESDDVRPLMEAFRAGFQEQFSVYDIDLIGKVFSPTEIQKLVHGIEGFSSAWMVDKTSDCPDGDYSGVVDNSKELRPVLELVDMEHMKSLEEWWKKIAPPQAEEAGSLHGDSPFRAGVCTGLIGPRQSRRRKRQFRCPT
eukprot:Skav217923  [mRNA]  locus=scaffold2633:25627:28751:- [translate_table: standard]